MIVKQAVRLRWPLSPQLQCRIVVRDSQVQKVGVRLHGELIEELGSLGRITYPALHAIWWRALRQGFDSSTTHNYCKMQIFAPLDPCGTVEAEELRNLASGTSDSAIKAKETLRHLQRDMDAIIRDEESTTIG
jgi:hypothetical protein